MINIVVDANIIFAALIKDNVTRFLLFREDLNIYAPEFLFVEIEKYSADICKKSGKTREELKIVLDLLMRTISIIPQEDIESQISYALKISPDPKDVSYIALALKLKCPLWSNDNELKKQKIVKIYSTEEIRKI